MASSILEAQRSAFEELERIEQAIADRVARNPGLLPESSTLSSSSSLHGKRKRPHRETVLQQHEIGRFLKRYKEQCEFLESSYDKKAGSEAAATAEAAGIESQHPAVLRKIELASLATTDGTHTTLLQQFYGQLAKVKDYHRRYPKEPVEDLVGQYEIGLVRARRRQQLQEEAALMGTLGEGDEPIIDISLNAANQGANVLLSAAASDLDLDSIFSGEEAYGKYLDLIKFHDQFLNLKFLSAMHQQMSYLSYLERFADFGDTTLFPFATRLRDPGYFKYTAELHAYLRQFLIKSNPLGHSETVLQKIEAEFNNAWEKKLAFPGWKFDQSTPTQTTTNPTNNVEDGVETPEGFYCTPCSKFFSKQTVYTAHLTGKKHKKNAQTSASQLSSQNQQHQQESQEGSAQIRLLAYHEYCVYSLCEFLAKCITDTRNNVERKRALTDRERQLENEALDQQDLLALGHDDNGEDGRGGNGDFSGGDDDDDEDEVIYNPLKLPLGWDRKPIPFWLWKLNGLGIEYTCQVCGNYSYMGRKAFDKHFMEARHIHGLKCFGITPGVLFKGITEIKDVLKLWEKVKHDYKQDEGRKESTIEMEDDEGNVMSEKVYNDLKKQGLL